MKIEKFKNNILLERRNFKDYNKYNEILKRKLSNFFRIEKLIIYKEDDIVYCEIKTWCGITDISLEYCKKYFGELSGYSIDPANGAQLIIIFNGLTNAFFEKVDIETNMNKYNI